ncbi:glycoside hydrolase family protein [Candidatus Woesearchaeota archaeon]|nr:glycoside hydrolase family protein [Candidatus Woesearchaeota archaeon]
MFHFFKKKKTKIASALALAVSLTSCFNDEAKEIHRREREAKDNLNLSQVHILEDDEERSKRIVLQLKVSKNYEERADQLMKIEEFKEAKTNYEHSFRKNDQALEELNLIYSQMKEITLRNFKNEKIITLDLKKLERELKERKTQIYLKFKEAKEKSFEGYVDIKLLRPSKKGIDFILGYEKFRPEAYKCQGKKWTVGYGHTKDVKKGDFIDRPGARKLFKEDIKEFMHYLRHYLKGHKLTQQQYDAFLSLMFNIGPGNFTKGEVYRLMKLGKLKEAIDAFGTHNTAGGKVSSGLINRRNDERKIANEGKYNTKKNNL